jgi:cytochrome c biogenesis protein CcmG, thiol:disulfide interchange protein DsbE
MNRWLKVVVLAVAALAVTRLVMQRSRPLAASGAPAPALALADLAGRQVDLAQLRGNVVAVNFWATWCGPCQLEIPELARAWQENHGRCFEILGVAEESARDDLEKASARIPYPVLVDERGDVAAGWKVLGYPHTFIIDAEGKVRRMFQGAVRRDELLDAVKPLLPASCPAR